MVGELYVPLSILGIKCSLSCGNVCVRRGDPVGSLQELPEAEQTEEDWNTDICS